MPPGPTPAVTVCHPSHRWLTTYSEPGFGARHPPSRFFGRRGRVRSSPGNQP